MPRKLIIVEAFPAVFKVGTVYPELRMRPVVPFWRLVSMTKHYGTFQLCGLYDYVDQAFSIPEPVEKRMKITHGYYWSTKVFGKPEITDIPEDTVFTKRGGEIDAGRPATKKELLDIFIAEVADRTGVKKFFDELGSEDET